MSESRNRGTHTGVGFLDLIHKRPDAISISKSSVSLLLRLVVRQHCLRLRA
jgi:hypothetical protein